MNNLDKRLTDALKALTGNENTLNNFASYLNGHYRAWTQKWAYDFESFVAEIEEFANIQC